ncbi:DNA replication and repair protein RecF [Candidatus Dojkabacteria bacterium]|uniref:DNA replication and repair protein RecF n=1 Tax=Candidatus Dojkabacteria bacterium TaxID=2099670 RepID=A0A955L2I1_9BACT|nr:DNA replication and repair protein RecF [Candidatus Dojkabacteria bacterium]
MLQHIKAYNYRNLENIDLALSDSINLLIAPNGFGKTNLIEMVYYSVFRASFRPLHSYAELLGDKDNHLKIELDWHNNTLETIISNTSKLQRKTLLNAKVGRKRKILENFALMLFAPHSVDLVNGEPKTRRDDLDFFIMMIEPNYESDLKTYNSVLKNRNALLKALREGLSSTKELKYWTDKIVSIGSVIEQVRINYIKQINEFVPIVSKDLYHDITGLKIEYLSNVEIENDNIENSLRQKYADNEQKEIIVGKTLYGPHKDDYFFQFDTNIYKDKNLKFHGSRGQQRIGSFLFKMAQAEITREYNSNDVLLFLDDIMSELDSTHRDNIAEFLIKKNYQIVITGADENEIPKAIQKNANIIKIKK